MFHLMFSLPWLIVALRFIAPLPWPWWVQLSLAVFLLLLRRYVTHPLEAITRQTIETSLGSDWQVAEPKVRMNGQFYDLEQSISRLRISLNEALRLFPDLGSGKREP